MTRLRLMKKTSRNFFFFFFRTLLGARPALHTCRAERLNNLCESELGPETRVEGRLRDRYSLFV